VISDGSVLLGGIRAHSASVAQAVYTDVVQMLDYG
jgi:hypothetical protein